MIYVNSEKSEIYICIRRYIDLCSSEWFLKLKSAEAT